MVPVLAVSNLGLTKATVSSGRLHNGSDQSCIGGLAIWNRIWRRWNNILWHWRRSIPNRWRGTYRVTNKIRVWCTN